MRAFALTLLLLASGTALARQPKEFVPRELTQEELEASRNRSKNNMADFRGDEPQESKPIPWKYVLFLGLAVLAAMPFALRMYNKTAEELEGNASFGAARGGGKAVDDE